MILSRNPFLAMIFFLASMLLLVGCSDSNDDAAECFASLLSSCAVDEYCKFTEGSCGAEGEAGVCTLRPELCAEIYAPVCGCDFVDYSNSCDANGAGVSVASQGFCPVFPIDCGEDGCE